jgi:hypothetical protein
MNIVEVISSANLRVEITGSPNEDMINTHQQQILGK